MSRKPPIRTYERRNGPNKAVLLCGPSFSAFKEQKSTAPPATKNTFDIESNKNDSLGYDDPFDTTFDRLARNVKLPPAPLKDEDNSWLSSSNNTSKDDLTEDDESVLRISNDLSHRSRLKHSRAKPQNKSSHKYMSKRKVSKQVTVSSKRKNLSRSSSRTIYSNKAFKKLKKDSSTKIEQKQQEKMVLKHQFARSVNNSTLTKNELSQREKSENSMDWFKIENSAMDLLLDIKPCSVKLQDCFKDKENIQYIKNITQREKSENTVDWLRMENSAMDLLLDIKPCSVILQDCSKGKENIQYIKNVGKGIETTILLTHNTDIKPCSVKLQDLYEDKENVKYIESIGKNIEATISMTHNTELSRDPKMKLNSSQSERTSLGNEHKIQKCFVKLEKMQQVSNKKNVISKSTAETMCSTPMHKHKAKGLHSLLLSPIPIYSNEKRAILTEQVNNESRNETDKSSTSLRLNDLDTDSCMSKKQSSSIKSVDILCDDASSTEPISIKNDQDHSCYDQSKSVVNKESMLEEYATTEKYLKTVGERKSDASAILLTDKSESLIEENERDINSLSSIQNTQHSVSDMFSQTGTSSSLMSESITDGASGNKSCANSTSKDTTESIEAKSIDTKETHETQLESKGNKTNLESIHSGSLSIEVHKSGNSSVEIRNDKSISILELSSQKDVENNSFQQLRVVLQQLQDPVRITNRRKQYHKWTLGLSRISCESSTLNNISNIIPESIKENAILPKPSDVDKSIGSTSVLKTDMDLTSRHSKKSFFLKPGKSWARSLSILNNIQNCMDVDGGLHGKGKKWSHSVKNVLDMQKEGIEESSFNETENIPRESLQITTTKLNSKCNTKSRTLSRISARMSFRVVRTGKPAKNTDDASFLEAYGILPIISPGRSTIPRQTLINNINRVTNLPQLSQSYSETKAKDAVMSRCKQTDFLSFEKHFSESYIGCCKKIGEGVYGEVFLHENESNKSVIKIIPIEGTESVNGEPQKKFGEILSEIVIAMELHNLRFSSTHWTDGFVKVESIKCVKGKYPDKLIELWKLYDDDKGSDNDCPSMFHENQLYIALELGHGGQDLEGYVFHTAEQALASFQQVAVTLAIAENALEFEHRDLHWGNVLISNTDEKSIYYKLPDIEFRVPTKGVKVSIIDFTLSRMSYESCCIFNDLASDPALFTAQGDYQFEIYRLMRETIGNQWEKFEPFTNILWLHYTLDKMITEVRYKKRNLKTHKNAIAKLIRVKKQILDYDTVYDFVINCDIFANVQRTNL